ncbi:MAG: phosphoserine phosphatase SerB [Alphaproteobacteria bacterium]
MDRDNSLTQILVIVRSTANSIALHHAIEAIKKSMLQQHCSIEGSKILEEGLAADIYFTSTQPVTPWLIEIKQQYQDHDFMVIHAPNRRKKLLVADMESTIIHQEMLDEMADHLGIKPQIATITHRAMNGELDFSTALQERLSLLKGLDEKILHDLSHRITYMEGAASLIHTMKKNGAYTALVSSGFSLYTKQVAAELGFDLQVANELDIQQGKLTGAALPPIRGGEAKKATLLALCQQLNISPDDAITVGDGANDLPMLQTAGMGIAFHAKPAVQQQAKLNITHTNLKSLLYAQGYHGHEII